MKHFSLKPILAFPLLIGTVFIVQLYFLFSSPAEAAEVIYVNHAAAGLNNGESWENAYTDLQNALSAATDGDEIWVAQGVYKPGNHELDQFNIVVNIAVYGGFDGSEASRNSRDWEANLTVLSGDVGDDDTTDEHGIVLTTTAQAGQNSYHVVQISADQVIFDGFTVTAGNADTDDGVPSGGGLYISSNQGPDVQNIRFVGNFARWGGAIYSSASDLAFSNLIIEHNQALNSGGGVYFWGGSSTFTDTIIRDNFSGFSGGGIGFDGANNFVESISFNNSSIENNRAGSNNGGGIMLSRIDEISLSNVTISGNIAAQYGGGLHVYSNTVSTSIENSTISQNTAQFGGGVRFEEAFNPLIANTIIAGNEADFVGGGIYNTSSSPAIVNSLITGNKAEDGGGMYNFNDSHAHLINSALVGNAAVDGAFSSGGAVYNFDSSPIFKNSIVWNNIDPSGTGTLTSSVSNNGSSTPTFQNSIVHGSGGANSWNPQIGTFLGGNLETDPLFAQSIDPTDAPTVEGDFQISTASPAFNVGNSSLFTATTSLDLAGTDRIQGSAIDIGPYEYPYYEINIDLPVSGGGSVTGTAQACAEDCSGSYPSGTEFTLTAIPDEEYVFTGWIGDCSGTDACVVTLSAEVSVGATFERRWFIFLPVTER